MNTTTTAAPGATPSSQPTAGDHLVPVSAVALRAIYHQLSDAEDDFNDVCAVLRAISSMIAGDDRSPDATMSMVSREEVITVLGFFCDRWVGAAQNVTLARHNVHPYAYSGMGEVNP